MQVKAELNYLHIAPRKVRIVANLLKGMDLNRARVTLRYLPKRASLPMLKLLNSAVAGAKHDFNLNDDNLFIDSIIVNAGPVLKRSRPRAFGRASMIKKRTSNVTLKLGEIKETADKKTLKKKKDITIRELKDINQAKDEFDTDKEIKRPDSRTATKTVIKKPTGFVRRMFRRKAI